MAKKPTTTARRARTAQNVRKLRNRRRLSGRCIVCGKPRGRSGSTLYCPKDLKAERLRKRKSVGSKRWKAGGPGRPPADATQSIFEGLPT